MSGLPGYGSRLGCLATKRWVHGPDFHWPDRTSIRGALAAAMITGIWRRRSMSAEICATCRDTGGHGQSPQASLIDVNGTLYGTTANRGVPGYGAVFALTKNR
jgi:hypothetical protein